MCLHALDYIILYNNIAYYTISGEWFRGWAEIEISYIIPASKSQAGLVGRWPAQECETWFIACIFD